MSKHAEFPNIPNAYDLVTSDEDRQLFQLIFGPWTYGRPLFAPPGTEPARVAALRAALAATLKDPAYLAETKKINMEIQPTRARDHRQAGGPDPAHARAGGGARAAGARRREPVTAP